MEKHLGSILILGVLLPILVAAGIAEGRRSASASPSLGEPVVSSPRAAAPVAADLGVALITVPFLALGLLLMVAYRHGVSICRRRGSQEGEKAFQKAA